jgi:hypothetical protein
MLAEIRAVHTELATLNAALTPALTEIRQDVQSNGKRLDRHGDRITALEQWRWKAVGAMAILAPAVSGVVAYLVKIS